MTMVKTSNNRSVLQPVKFDECPEFCPRMVNKKTILSLPGRFCYPSSKDDNSQLTCYTSPRDFQHHLTESFVSFLMINLLKWFHLGGYLWHGVSSYPNQTALGLQSLVR